MGACYVLTQPDSWQKDGDLTPDECALMAQQWFDDAFYGTTVCELAEPYWDDPEADDASSGIDNPEYPFYEDVAQFAIAGFVLYATGSPATAMEFWTVANQFRLAFRKSDVGGIVKIFMDAIQIGEIDTAGTPSEIINFDVMSTGSTLRLEFPTEGTITEVLRKRLWAGEIVPSSLRYVTGTDTVEFYDGTSWRDCPEFDPRHGIGYQNPLRTTDAQCDAAANMVDKIRHMIDSFLTLADIVAVINAWGAIIALFAPGFSLFIELLIAIAEAFTVTGIVAIELAFTDPTYDQLLCIIYGEIGVDGSMNAEQFDTIYARIEAEMPGVQFGVLSLLWNLLGEVGLTNAGSQGDEVGDCDTCVDLCPIWDFTMSAEGWDLTQDYGAIRDSGGLYGAGVVEGVPEYKGITAKCSLTVPAGCTITGFSFTVSAYFGSDPGGHFEAYVGTDRTDGLAATEHVYASDISSGLHEYTRSIVGSGQTVIFAFGGSTPPNPMTQRFTRAEIMYEGEKPIFGGGTPCA